MQCEGTNTGEAGEVQCGWNAIWTLTGLDVVAVRVCDHHLGQAAHRMKAESNMPALLEACP